VDCTGGGVVPLVPVVDCVCTKAEALHARTTIERKNDDRRYDIAPIITQTKN
jgi:hypothetical protein